MALLQSSSQDWLLPTLIDHRARIEPDAIWTQYPASPSTYDEGFKTVTYKDFANAVNGAARWIETTLGGKSSNHEVLAYIGPNDVRYIIFVVAAVKAGYAMLLISPRNSLAAQLNLFKETGCRRLITTSPEPPAIQPLATASGLPVFHVPAVDELLGETHEHYAYDKEYSQSKHEPLLVLHTSGSTGLPKSIVYTHEFAVTYQRSLISAPPEGYYSMNSLFTQNRMFFMLPPFHAGGVLMHLINAVNNKTVVVTPTALTPPTARGLAEALKHVEVDVAFGTPLTCIELNAEPEVLDAVAAKLPTFFYAGGDCPKPIGDKISEKLKLFTIVGYTECGNLNQIRPVGPWSTEWKYIQLDPGVGAEFRHLHDDLYQHWIVRKPELEHKQAPFKLFPELQEYTSKDIFSPHPTKPDLWTHRGRADDIIVLLNGEKTNPVSFEGTVAKAPEVTAALVIGAQRFQAALLIEPKTAVSTATARAELLESIWPFVEEANSTCPAHARVARSHVLFTVADKPFVRAGKGTVIREQSLALYREETNKLYEDADKQNLSASKSARPIGDATPADIGNVIHDSVLKVTQWSSLGRQDDFFVRGMDSLQVLMLVRDIKATYQCETLAASIIYTTRTVESLVEALINLGSTETRGQLDATTRFRGTMETSLAYHIRELDELKPVSSQRTSGQTTPRTVLLTGSTGAIGSYLLQALLAKSDISHVFCINRSQNSAQLQAERNETNGLPSTLDSNRVTLLTGDLSKTSFGLEEEQYQKLSDSITDVLHVAWPVNFNKSLESFEPSLQGVVKLVDFSLKASHLPRITYVSSISAVFGTATSGSSKTIPEVIVDDPAAPGQTGYAASKHVSERLLSHATGKYGTLSTVLRVGQVAGPAHGKGFWASQEWLPSLVISSATLGVIPNSFGVDGSSGDQDVDWVPIDILAEAILDIALDTRDADAKGTSTEVYHLNNPKRTAWSTLVPGLQKSISAATGRRIDIVSFAEWVERLKAASRRLLEDTTSTPQNGVDVVSKTPALKLLDFYEGLLRQPLSGEGVAVLETKLAESKSEALRQLGPVTPELMNKWLAGWDIR